jgi:hypothetical protein
MVYVGVLFVRLLFSAGSLHDRWEDVLWPVLLMAVAWGIVWLASNAYVMRRVRARFREH